MCGPAAATIVGALVTTAFSVGSQIVEYKAQKKTNEYNKQIAINQIRTTQNEAQNQIQDGIDKSRQEKLQSRKTVSKLVAKNAANGFDVYSTSNLYNYEDINDDYENSAKNILDSYYKNANSYNKQASDQIKQYDYKQSMNGLNSIGTTMKVASNWYNTANNVLGSFSKN